MVDVLGRPVLHGPGPGGFLATILVGMEGAFIAAMASGLLPRGLSFSAALSLAIGAAVLLVIPALVIAPRSALLAPRRP